jgi:hypothetical protein
MTVVVRAGGSPSAVVPAIRATLLSIDATLPLYQVRTLEESLAESTAQPQLTTTLTAVFGRTRTAPRLGGHLRSGLVLGRTAHG